MLLIKLIKYQISTDHIDNINDDQEKPKKLLVSR